MTFRRNDIYEVSAVDHADPVGRLPLDIAETFNLVDQLGHDANSAAADALGDTGVRRPSVGMKLVAQKCVASGDELVGLSRLGDQDIAVCFCLCLDKCSGRGTADFLIRDE